MSAACLYLLSRLLSPVPAPTRLTALGLAVFAAVVIDVLGKADALPQNRRQIPKQVFSGDVLRAAGQFGFEMGLGTRTYVSTSAPYLLAFSVVMLGPGAAHLAMATTGFGLGRSMVLLLRAASGGGDSEWDERLAAGLKWLVPLSTLLGATCAAFAAVESL